MKHLLEAVIGKIRPQRASAESILAKFCKRHSPKFRLASVVDRRQLVEATEKALGREKFELARLVAKQLNLVVVQRAAEIECADSNLLVLAERYAAIPIRSNGIVVAISCSNPDLLPAFCAEAGLKQWEKLPVYLTHWSILSETIASYARRLNAATPQAAPTPSSYSEVGIKLLTFLLAQARKLEAGCLILDLNPARAQFSFAAGSGKQARGEIDSRVVPALKSDLSAALEGNAHDMARAVDWPLHLKLSLSAASPDLFEFSWHEKKEAKSLEVNAADTNSTQAEKKILLVDDNAAFLKVLERFLSRLQIEVIATLSAEEALSVLEQHRAQIAAMVCDVHMPGMNGFDMLKSVRSRVGKDFPIIMLTSDEDVETELRLINAGASVYLAKSEDPRVLCAYLKNFLHNYSATRLAA